MQTFDFFHAVYCFFVRVSIDAKYVKTIDDALENGTATKEIKQLIQQVKTFHRLRASLCNSIREHLNSPKVLNILVKAHGIEQYNSVPEESKCIVSKQILKPKQGILLMVNGMTPFTIHVRYKNILYNYWFLAHMPKEIALETKQWFSKQKWWSLGKIKSLDVCVERMSMYQDKMFSKKMYVKLKGISQYIQTELSSLPINQPVQTSV